ncbi:class I SAM-dependent methyltransferase [Methylomonas sp. EbB]|uniref:Class I SAM-dependent methyltransferase n=2 Tax=Methylomonas fluvii TaxID=1854564 RepID=A0ABR9D8D6_9GAMM|nr:class I SAM-dependent methyltransferase [Methylomonas fluvii]
MRSRSGAELRSVICKDCGLVWSDPFPHDPRQFYEEDYRLEYKNTYAPKAKHILRAGRVALARHEKIKHLLHKPQTLLDVGTGGGEFAYLIKSLGHDLHGIEPNKGYGQYSAAQYDLNLQFGFIQDAQFAENSFDVITIWHVLEHTEDPLFVLGKLRSLLKPDGVLVVEVPNIEATCQSPSSTFHEAHLYNFNLATLRRMGEKAGLIEDRHVFSEDGGNVTMFFKKAEHPADQAMSWGIPENAERISAIVRGHSNLRHYMRAAPYLRFIKRMTRSLLENRHVKGFDNNKSLLDQLYRGL